jgi:Mrp family chromosome partitioning ATPase
MVVTLAAVAAAVAWVSLRPANYEATANLLVTPVAQEDQTFRGLQVLRDSGDPTRSVQTAANLVHSAEAARRTASQLGGDWTENKVLDAVTVTPEGESNILAVTAKADGAEKAARLANTFASSALAARRDTLSREATAAIDRLESRRDELGPDTEALATVIEQINALENVQTQGDPTMQLSQSAQVPESASGLPIPVIVILAALAGFTLGSGAALLLELTERRIRNEDEAVALYPLPVLARIPLLKASQLRGRQASGWHMLPAVREAFRTLMIQLGPHPEGRAQVVMVTSASTGDGKTTSAVNLAAAAAASGDPVILLDFDLRKPDVGRTLGVQAGTELTGLLQPNTQLRDLLSPAPGLPALSVLTTTVAEGDVALVEALSRRLPELIADARELCNYVVIDTAPIGEISDALRLVGDVDNIIVVTKPGNTNRANFEMMRDLLERTAYTPAGFLVIGDDTPRTSAYYAYGATGRELFLGADRPPAPPAARGPVPGRGSVRIVEADAGARGQDRPVRHADSRSPERANSQTRSSSPEPARGNGAKDGGGGADAERSERSPDRRPSGDQDPARKRADGEPRSEGQGDSRGDPDRGEQGRSGQDRGASEVGAHRGGPEGGSPHRRPPRPPRSDERSSRGERGERPQRSQDRPSKG